MPQKHFEAILPGVSALVGRNLAKGDSALSARGGATMAQILGRALSAPVSGHTNRVYRELQESSGYEGYYRCVGKFVEIYLGALVPYAYLESNSDTLKLQDLWTSKIGSPSWSMASFPHFVYIGEFLN